MIFFHVSHNNVIKLLGSFLWLLSLSSSPNSFSKAHSFIHLQVAWSTPDYLLHVGESALPVIEISTMPAYLHCVVVFTIINCDLIFLANNVACISLVMISACPCPSLHISTYKPTILIHFSELRCIYLRSPFSLLCHTSWCARGL